MSGGRKHSVCLPGALPHGSSLTCGLLHFSATNRLSKRVTALIHRNALARWSQKLTIRKCHEPVA